MSHKDEIIKYAYTKEKIEAQVNEKWQELGYKEKPTKYIALTFDDGPCPSSAYGGTEAMLAALEDLNVKATFFVIGNYIRDNKAAAQAIFDAGHELGNHSDSHVSFGSADKSDIAADLEAASNTIKEIQGGFPLFFRAPYLSYGDNLSLVCEEMGMPLIDGSAIPGDWPGEPSSIKNGILSNPQDGGIILLHENNTSQGNTMSVLPDIVAGLREKGFWICTVGQLASVKEKTLTAGQTYKVIK